MLIFDWIAVPGSSEALTNRLLLRLMSSITDIKQTQNLHSAMLQSLTSQLQASDVHVTTEQLPEDITFPANTVEDMADLQLKLQNVTSKRLLVSSSS